MARKASSVSAGNSKSGPFTSTSTTSAPNERKAFAAPVPVAIETSRSEPGPPINTAIFFGKALISSRFLPHDLYFGFQFHAAFLARHVLNPRNQLEHLGCGRPPFVDDKISVNLRDTRLPHSRIFQSQLIDQFPRRTALRIFEKAAGTLRARLRRAAFLLRFVEAPHDLFRRRRNS